MTFDQFLFSVVGIGIIAFALFTGLFPLVVLGGLLLVVQPRADKIAIDVIETSPPGDGCGLVLAWITGIIVPVIVVVGLVLAVTGGAL